VLTRIDAAPDGSARRSWPDLLLGLEKVLILLLDQGPAKHAPEEVDVPPQWLVLWLEADPGRRVSVGGTRHRRSSAAVIHAR
jgi:hypothetical protein